MATQDKKYEILIKFKDRKSARYFMDIHKGICALDPDVNTNVFVKADEYEGVYLMMWAASRNLLEAHDQRRYHR